MVILCLKPVKPPYCMDLELLTQDFILSIIHDTNLFLLVINDHSTQGICFSYYTERTNVDIVCQCAKAIRLNTKIRSFFQRLPCTC